MTAKYLTVQEVADIFRRSKRTILRWIEEGNPITEFTRVRDGVLIPESEVERILAEGKNQDISDIAEPEVKKKRHENSFVNRWRK